jgi:hypothetical protein
MDAHRLGYIRGGSHARLGLQAGGKPHVIYSIEIKRVCHGQFQNIMVQAQRQYMIFLGDIFIDKIYGIGVNRIRRNIDKRDVQLVGKGLCYVKLRGIAFFNEQRADTQALILPAVIEHAVKLLLSYEACFDQEFAYFFYRHADTCFLKNCCRICQAANGHCFLCGKL